MATVIVTTTALETRNIAKHVAATVTGGTVLALTGPLGAGKTTFTQALARAFGIKRSVRSPTFVRLIPYKLPRAVRGIRTLVHIDAYRVKETNELLQLGLDEYLGRADTIIVIEWADRVRKILPKQKTTWVSFALGRAPDERRVTIR